MSFDLFVGRFKGGERAHFPRKLVDQAFLPFIERREPNCLILSFGDEGESYLYRNDSDLIDEFSINRPVASGRLYAAILEVLRAESLVLYMPGDAPPLVGREDSTG